MKNRVRIAVKYLVGELRLKSDQRHKDLYNRVNHSKSEVGRECRKGNRNSALAEPAGKPIVSEVFQVLVCVFGVVRSQADRPEEVVAETKA